MLWLIFWIALAVLLCGLCSLLEATFLSIRMSSLFYLVQQDRAGAKALLAIRRNRPADAISAILTINTLAGMVGATFAGAAAAGLWGEPSVAWVSLAMTMFMLFVSEIGPKTFAAAHTEQLADWTGRVLAVLLTVMKPLLPITRTVTRLLSGDASAAVTRRALAATIAAAPLEGAITTPESELLTHIVYVHGVTVASIETPLEAVVMLPETCTAGEFVGDRDAEGFSRIPVYRGQRDDISGYVLYRDILRHLAAGGSPAAPITDFVREMPRLSSALTLRIATDQLLRAREAIALVTDQAGKTTGIVTLEDLLETLTGIEITDEAEDIAALRPAAEDARRRRIAALRADEKKWASAREEGEDASST